MPPSSPGSHFDDRTLTLESWSRARRQLAYTARLGSPENGYRFSTRFWFDSMDLPALEERHGRELMERLYFHAVAFDMNRLLSLAPERVSFGPLARHATAAFRELWERIFDGVWAEWRYRNRLPGYPLPEIVEPAAASAPASEQAARIAPGEVSSLVFCGGGKDSLLALKLFEAAGEPYDSLVYSHSIYGDHARQHALVEKLLAHGAPRHRHRAWIFDDFLAAPVLDLAPELTGDRNVGSITAAETPASLFLTLPLALAHGFTRLVLAHEKSADRGNLVWEETGEEVNHQWGKSLEAEDLLARYVRRHLVENLSYFSVLAPAQDAVIVPALSDHLPAVAATHSCNVAKPWCRRCAKCAYVWLLYRAFLPREAVDPIFGGENLLDFPENEIWFRQMLGLADHTPFECVGQVEETRLAFELLARRGGEGRAMEMYRRAFPDGSGLPAEWRSLFDVEGNEHRIPDDLASRVVPRLAAEGRRAREWVEKILSLPS